MRGALAVLFGLTALIMPSVMLAAVARLFGGFAILDGLVSIGAGVHAGERNKRSWPLVVEGILGLFAGLIIFVLPAATTLTLAFLVAVWAILMGIMRLASAVHLRNEIPGEWLLIVTGILSLLLGTILLLLPGPGLLVLVWWIGVYALILGVIFLALALKLRILPQSEGFDTPSAAVYRPSATETTQALYREPAREVRPMDVSTQIAIERAKAEKKSPVVLWLVNLIWPGLGNLVVGQTGLGILFGLLQWLGILVAVVTLGFGAVVLLINWVVAGAVGHSRINKDYATALDSIQAAAMRQG